MGPEQANELTAWMQERSHHLHILRSPRRVDRTEAGVLHHIIKLPGIGRWQGEDITGQQIDQKVAAGCRLRRVGDRRWRKVHPRHLKPMGSKQQRIMSATNAQGKHLAGCWSIGRFQKTHKGRSGLPQIPSGGAVLIATFPKGSVQGGREIVRRSAHKRKDRLAGFSPSYFHTHSRYGWIGSARLAEGTDVGLHLA